MDNTSAWATRKTSRRFSWRQLFRHRVPVILQLTPLECGAACLTMLLNYYERPTTLAECREKCSINRDGMTAETLISVARHYGLRVKAYSVQDINAFVHLPLPVIVHWDFRHFVVVEKWSSQRVDIVDPAVGRRRLSPEEFAANFTGVAFVMEPGVYFNRQPSTTNAKLTGLSYLRKMLAAPGIRAMLPQILAASLLIQLLGLSLPLSTKLFIDQVLPYRLESIMGVFGLGILVLLITQLMTGYLRGVLLVYLQGRLDSQLMIGFFEHLLSLPFTFFQQRSSGDLLMRLGSNTMVRELLTGRTISAMLDGLLVIGYLVIILTWSFSFGLVVLAIALVQVAILVAAARPIHHLLQQDLMAQADSEAYLVEALQGIVTIKSSGVETQTLHHWSNLFHKQLNIAMQRNQLTATIEAMLTAVRTFSPLILLWVGALYVLNGTMSLGAMLAVSTLGSVFLTPVASLVSTGQSLQMVRAYLDRIMDVLKAAPEQISDQPDVKIALSGRIEVRNVSFRYGDNAPFTLQDISFNILPGQKVALVGQTGSGKSTLAMLLLGLYKPEEGEIYYDDHPLSELNYHQVRHQFGVVPQEPFLFNGSIRQNIAFSNHNLSLEEIRDVARFAAIEQEIMQMPMAYETLVAEGGSALSGGQRQRLAIARAIAHNPKILLLDEATSHLDVVTENLINQNLNKLDCTRIVIAHRLSTIRDADLILVLHNGQIIEQGNHQQLLSGHGYYARLVHDQLETSCLPHFSPIPA